MEQIKNLSFKLNESTLRKQVEEEKSMGFSFISKKRQIWREQDELYAGSADTNKIDMRTLFYNVQTWMSTYYTDRLNIKFSPRRFGKDEEARNLSNVAMFDYDEMGLDEVNYEAELNRILRGVSIRAYVGYDTKRECPIFKTMDTRDWYPDPMGWLSADKFRFHWFDAQSTLSEVSDPEEYFQENVEEMKVALQSEGVNHKTNRAYAERSMNLNNVEEGSMSNPQLNLYYHYTRVIDEEGKVHTLYTEWDSDVKFLLRVREIEAVYEEEKSNGYLIPFGVELKYFCPQPYNPTGISLADLIQDKHKYKNVFANLMFIREKDAALGDDILFDTNIVKNPNDLTRPTITKKYIGADGTMGNIGNAVAVIPKNPAPSSNYNFLELLDRGTELATGIDARQMGISGGAGVTLGEAQQIQSNANLRIQYINNIGLIGEKSFWKTWLRAYHENFGKSSKKIVRVADSFGQKPIVFTKKDFLSEEDPDIKIDSQSDLDAKRRQDLQNLNPMLQIILADPSKSEFVKGMALKKALILNGMREDEADAFVSPSFEELDAKNKLVLINNNDPDGAKINPNLMDVDHSVYVTIFKQAIDNDIKWVAIEARNRAILQQTMMKKESMQQQEQAPQDMRTVQNAAMSSSIAQQGASSASKVSSRQGG